MNTSHALYGKVHKNTKHAALRTSSKFHVCIFRDTQALIIEVYPNQLKRFYETTLDSNWSIWRIKCTESGRHLPRTVKANSVVSVENRILRESLLQVGHG